MQEDLAVLEFDDMEPSANSFSGKANGSILGPMKILGIVNRIEQTPSYDDHGRGGVPCTQDSGSLHITGLDLKMNGLGEPPTVLCARVTMEDGNPLRWKGKWWYAPEGGSTDVTNAQTFELLRRPPEAYRFVDLLKNVTSSSTKEPALGGDHCTTTTDSPTSVIQPPTAEIGPTVSKMPSLSLAAARWKYCISTVLFQVRQRRFSKTFYMDRANERRLWIALSLRQRYRDLVTSPEICEFLALRKIVHPNSSYLWECVANFYEDRRLPQSVTSSVLCNDCWKECCFVRYFCVTCQLESFDDGVDICAKCLNNQAVITTASGGTKFTHRPSHTIFKSHRRILGMERAHQVNLSRALAKRVKRHFRDDTTHRPSLAMEDHPLAVDKVCNCCKKDVELPCWVCTMCPGVVLICGACELTDGHDTSHPLLRIVDSNETEGQETDQLKMVSEDMMTVSSRMDKLVDQVDQIQRAIASSLHPNFQAVSTSAESPKPSCADSLEREGGHETKLVERIDALETRLSSIEILLQQVLTAVNDRK